MTSKPLSKNLSPRQRLEALRALVRHKSDESKRLTGRVSEVQSEFKSMMNDAVPQTHEGCVQRLKDLQQRYKEIDDRKGVRATFKRKAKEAEYQILFEDIREGEQVELPGTEVVITLETIQHLQAATAATREADKSRLKDNVAHDPEDGPAPKLPPPADPKVLADLEAALDGWAAEAKLSASALPTEGQAVHPDEAKPAGRKPGAANVPQPVH